MSKNSSVRWESLQKTQKLGAMNKIVPDVVYWTCACILLTGAAYGMYLDVFREVFSAGGLSRRQMMMVALVIFGNVVVCEAVLPLFHMWLKKHVRGGSFRRIRVETYLLAAEVQFFLLAKKAISYYHAHQPYLENGMLVLARSYIEKYNYYYGTRWNVPQGRIEWQTQALTFCIIISFPVLWNLSICFKKRVPLLLYPALVFVAELWVGYAPQAFSMVFAVAGIFLLFYGGKKQGKNDWKPAFMAGAIMIAGICLMAVLKQPLSFVVENGGAVRSMHVQMERQIATFISASRDKTQITLGNEAPYNRQKVIFEVVSDGKVEGNLYFKTFYGNVYQNGTWINDEEIFSDICEKAGFSEENVRMQMLEIPLLGRKTYGSGQNVRNYVISYTKGDSILAVLPYFCVPAEENPAQLSFVGDIRAKKQKRETELVMTGWDNQRTANKQMFYFEQLEGYDKAFWQWYDVYAAKSSYSCGCSSMAKEYAAGIFSVGADSTAEEWDKYTAAGKADVDNLYINRKALVCSNANLRNIARLWMADYVKTVMAHNFTYQLQLDAIPEGTDAVDYFMGESRQGYCMHFASAGALILQEMGIPARFADGYVVEKSLFAPEEDGKYRAQVRDTCAHAWVEVYLDGAGWVPVEMTPGNDGTYDREYASGQQGHGASGNNDRWKPEGGNLDPVQEETGTEETGTEETQAKPPAQTGADGNPPNIGGNSGTDHPTGAGSGNPAENGGWKTALGWCGAAAALVLVLFGIGRKLFAGYESADSRLKKQIRKKRYNQAVLQMNRRLYQGLRKKGKYGKLHYAEYRNMLTEQYGQVSGKNWEEFLRIADKAAFSGRDISKEDFVFCNHIYQLVFLNTMKYNEGEI